MRYFLLLAYMLFFFVLPRQAGATHLMGGDLTYKAVGNNKVEISFAVYRDCSSSSNAAIDAYIDYRIYNASAVAKNDFTKYTDRRLNYTSKKSVKPDIPNCKIPNSVCVEYGAYVDTITLGTDTVGYHVVWMRNERNNSAITNLDYGSCNWWQVKQPYGMTWYTFIPPKSTTNSSPQFLSLPIPYLCAGRTNVFNPLVSDADGDSLVFSLETPYSPPGDCNNAVPTPVPPGHSNFQKVVYKTGYSVNNPFGGSSSISIDSRTGEITAKPASTGNYVIAMQVKEYRVDPVTKKAVLVGEVRRDIQFVVGSCPANPAPTGVEDSSSLDSTQVDTSKKQTFIVNPGDTIQFTVIGKDTADTLYISAKGGIFKQTPTIVPPYATFTNDTALKEVKGKFFWVPTCSHVTYTSPHVVTVNISDNGCNTTQRTYSIYVRSPIIQKPPKLHCLQIVNDSTIKITTSDSATKKDFKQYNIYRRKGLTGVFQLIDTFSSVPIKSYTDYKTKGNDTVVYSYFIKAKNTCNLEGMASDTLSTVLISAKKLTHKKVKFSWNRFAGAKTVKYKLLLDEGSGFKHLDSTTKNEVIIERCDASVTLKIETGDAVCVYKSPASKTIRLIDTLKPKAPNAQFATVLTHKKIQFSFRSADSNDVVKNIIYRSANGGAFTVIDTLKNLKRDSLVAYMDTSVNASANYYCYKVLAVDSCGNTSVSGTHCTSLLKGKSGNTQNILYWTKYSGFTIDKPEIQRFSVGTWQKIASTANVNDTSFTDTTAKCNVSYYYRIVYRQSSGSFYSYSDTIQLKTTDTLHPAQVNILRATVSGATSIKIEFNAVADKDVKKYEIYAKENSGSFSKIATISTPFTSPYTYTHSSIDPLNKTYTYQVFAVDSCNALKSLSAETHSPVQLSGAAGNYKNTLSWSGYKGFTGMEYILQRYNAGWKTLDTLSATDTTYTHAPLTCNVTQFYRIITRELSGDKAFSVSDSIALKPFDTVKPAQPVIHFATVKPGDTSIYVSWKKSFDTDVKKYILRRTNNFNSSVYMDTILLDTFYLDKGIDADNKIYSYSIRAMDSCAENIGAASVVFSNILLNTKIVGCTQEIVLTWKKDKIWPSVKNIKIYRSADGAAEQLFATLPGADSTYTDTAVAPKHFYIYRLEAFSGDGIYGVSSNTTDTLRTFIPEPPFIQSASKTVTDATNGQIVITWNSQLKSRHMHFHKLFHRPRGSAVFSLLADSIPVSKNSYTHIGINTKTADHEYLLLSYDSCGNLADSATAHTTTELQMTVGQLVHDLHWSPYMGFEDTSATPVKYIIQHLRGGVWDDVDSVFADTSWKLFPAPCNYNIFYRVKAVSPQGYFAYSDTAGGQAIDTIPANAPVLNNLSVLNGSQTQLDFRGADSADIYGYSIIRKNTSGAFESVGFVDFTSVGDMHIYMDSVNATDDAQCYTIATLDSCLNATFSDTFCTIQLKGTEMNQAVQLNWQPFVGYPVKNYEVQVWKNNIWQTEKMLTGTDTALYIDTLACGIPVTYRMIGYGSTYKTYSDSVTLVPFDTILPTAPQLHFATAVLGKGMQLSWSWDVKSDVKYFEIWREDSTAANTKIATVSYDSTYLDTSIFNLNHIWKYSVVAIDSCDMSHRSAASDADQTMHVKAETWACRPEVRLNWTPYIALGKNTSGYNIYRSTGGGAFDKIADVKDTVLHYTDTTVDKGTTYCYRIEAFSATGIYAAFSDSVCIEPIVYPAPASVEIKTASVTKTGATDGEVFIEWTKLPSGDPFARGYRLYAAQSQNGPYALIFETNNLDSTSFTHRNLDTRRSNYFYYVAPYNLCGKEAVQSKIHKTVNLNINNLSLDAILLWNSYKGFTVSHYEIEKAEGNGAPVKTFVVPAADTIFSDTNIYCKKHYTYRIKAVELGGNGMFSYSDSLGINAYDNVPPQRPEMHYGTVIFTHDSLGKAEIEFNSVPDKNRRGYVIYRAVGNGSFEAIDTIIQPGAGIIKYIDESIGTHLNSHAYYVRAIDSCGNIGQESEIHRLILLRSTAKNAYNDVRWNAYTGFGSYNYVLERRTGAGAWLPVATLPSTATNYIDSAVKCHLLYEYRITAINANNLYSSVSNTDTARAFEVNLPENPDISYASVTATGIFNGEITVNWQASASADAAEYILYRRTAAGTWTQIIKLPSATTTYIDVNQNTYRQSYEYKIQVIDSCGNISYDNSEIHRTINLTGTPGNENISLNWNAYKGFEVLKYELYKNGALYMNLDPFTFNFTDTLVICGNTYTYQIRAIDKNTGNFAYSNKDSLQPFDTRAPRKLYAVSASVTKPNTEVTVSWTASRNYDILGYNLFRRNYGKGNVELVYSTQNKFDTVYTDTLVLNGDEFCYYVVAFDHCNNLSEASNNACVINLFGKADKDKNHLSWQPYKVWQRGVDYYNIYRRKDNGSSEWIASVPGGGNTFTDIETELFIRDFCYRVEAVEVLGGYEATAFSTEVCVHQDAVIYIPNAFTPEVSPNVNDVFEPVGTYIASYEMKIYNRWGQKVFETNGSKGWSGHSESGERQPEGVYMYTIKYYNFDGKPNEIKGTVHLLW